jgi:hypothetical protein
MPGGRTISTTLPTGSASNHQEARTRAPAVAPNFPRFDGAVWRAVAFVYLDKRVLLRVLREMGAQAAETCIPLRSTPDDLPGARRAADASRFAPESRSEALAAE